MAMTKHNPMNCFTEEDECFFYEKTFVTCYKL